MAAGRYGNGTTFAELLLGTKRSIIRGASGAVTESAADPTVPPAISNLQLASVSVLDNYQGAYVSIVKASWDPIVADTSENADPDLSPVSDYLCSYAYADEGWSREGGTGGVNAFTTHAVPTGVEVTVRVRARRASGAVGPYTTATIVTARDETPPPRPSAPTLIGTLRGVAVVWDGLFVQPDGTGSAPRPADFAYVIAEVATQADFSDIVKGGVLSEAGMTAVTRLTDGTPFTAYARLVAVDHSGNRSALSTVTQGGSIPIVAADIGGGAVTTAKLADAAITAQKILDGAVDTFKLADGAVVNSKLSNLAVSVDKIVDGAVTASKTALAAIDPNSGTLAINSVATNNLQAGAVTADVIATNAVIARHIVAGEVITEKLAANAVVAEKINALAITTEKINAGAVETLKVAANAITTKLLAAGAVVADTLAAEAVTSKVVTGGVIRTGVSGEDRMEMRDETVFDSYLGYSRSIRDSLRWVRGFDGALVAEVRGYMGDIGAYGLHLNANMELGNVNSTIYQVGRRSASHSSTQLRVGTLTAFCDGNGNWEATFNPALPVSPGVVVAVPGSDAGTNMFIGFAVSSWTYDKVFGRMRYLSGTNILNPGAGTQFAIRYYAECTV